MKTIFISVCAAIICICILGCSRSKCSDNGNATITGYDQTKSLCGTGFIMQTDGHDDISKKQYLVRELTGDYATQIKIDSKFPISIVFTGKLDPIENCTNVISTLEVHKPKLTCPE